MKSETLASARRCVPGWSVRLVGQLGGEAALGVAAGDPGADQDVDPVQRAGPEAADQFGGVLFGVVEVSAERDVQGHAVRILVRRRADRR